VQVDSFLVTQRKAPLPRDETAMESGLKIIVASTYKFAFVYPSRPGMHFDLSCPHSTVTSPSLVCDAITSLQSVGEDFESFGV